MNIHTLRQTELRSHTQFFYISECSIDVHSIAIVLPNPVHNNWIFICFYMKTSEIFHSFLFLIINIYTKEN